MFKKSGSANLVTVFGELDIPVRSESGQVVTVEIQAGGLLKERFLAGSS